MSIIRSRDNPRVKRWAKLARDGSLRTSEKRAILEGSHLVAEALAAGLEPLAFIVSEAALQNEEVRRLLAAREPVVLAERVFGIVAQAETPQGIAAEIEIPQPAVDGSRPTVFLEGVQDPSNVGGILRSAAAFGVSEVVLDRACADAWSPKALRAGMGGHFRLALRRAADLGKALEEFSGTTVCTVSSGGTPLPRYDLAGRLGWIFGAEGRGVSDAIARQARIKLTIPTAPGTQSLNVAAAAAICLYEAFSRPAGGYAAHAGSS